MRWTGPSACSPYPARPSHLPQVSDAVPVLRGMVACFAASRARCATTAWYQRARATRCLSAARWLTFAVFYARLRLRYRGTVAGLPASGLYLRLFYSAFLFCCRLPARARRYTRWLYGARWFHLVWLPAPHILRARLRAFFATHTHMEGRLCTAFSLPLLSSKHAYYYLALPAHLLHALPALRLLCGEPTRTVCAFRLLRGFPADGLQRPTSSPPPLLLADISFGRGRADSWRAGCFSPMRRAVYPCGAFAIAVILSVNAVVELEGLGETQTAGGNRPWTVALHFALFLHHRVRVYGRRTQFAVYVRPRKTLQQSREADI